MRSFLLVAFICVGSPLLAQWSGPSDLTSPISRTGSVSMGAVTSSGVIQSSNAGFNVGSATTSIASDGFSLYLKAGGHTYLNTNTTSYITNSGGGYFAGNVGIGIDTPLEKLHINGSVRGASFGGSLRINTGNGYVDIGPMNSSWSHFQTDRPLFYFNKPVTIDGGISSYSSNDLFLQTNGTTRIAVLNANGKVGIGVTNPSHALSISSSDQHLLSVTSASHAVVDIESGAGLNSYIRFRNAGADKWDFTSEANGNLRIYDYGASTARMVVTPSGNIGIGTTTPSARLQVTTPNQSVKFLTGTSTSWYELEVGVNDNGVNFSNNSTIRGFNFSNAAGNLMSITHGGSVGIGTVSPNEKLDVRGNLVLETGGHAGIFTGTGSVELNRYLKLLNSVDYSSASGLKAGGVLVSDSYDYANPSKNDLIVKGKVGIGTPLASNPNNYSLAVNGKIGSKEVVVEINSTTWPDYVFSPEYKLPSLLEVEKFIKENKHLPEVPSAEEVKENGLSVGEMNAILLKKVEELTLHIINQQKQIENQQTQITELKNKIK